MDDLQKMGRGDVGHVEGRILTHEDDVHPGKVANLQGAWGVMIALCRPQRDASTTRQHAALLQGQVMRLIDPKAVAARLGLQHHLEGGVGVDIDPHDGVHLNGDLKRHEHP